MELIDTIICWAALIAVLITGIPMIFCALALLIAGIVQAKEDMWY